MRRQLRKGLPRIGDALRLAFNGFRRRYDTGFDSAIENAVTRALRGFRVAIQAAHLWRLR